MPRSNPRIDDYVPPGSPTHGGVSVGVSRQRTRLSRRRRFAAKVESRVVQVWHAHPVSVSQAVALGDIYGRGINGSRGTISTGSSRSFGGAAADPAVGWAGYTAPPQLFTGWNPAYQAHVGTPIKDAAANSLPYTSVPLGSASPMDAAMSSIMAGSL